MATLTLLAGLILMGAAGQLYPNIAALEATLKSWRAVLSVSGPRAGATFDKFLLDGTDIRGTMRELEKIKAKQAKMHKAGRGAIATALIGYEMIYKALLWDIDIAADGKGALETLFGGGK
jgi:hypothetical protein